MKNKILWIEDESFMMKGLLRPLQLMGYEIDIASSAAEAFIKAKKWMDYDILVVDIIIPLSNEEVMPDEIKKWGAEPYVGIGLAKWLAQENNVKCPILLMSIIGNPISIFELDKFGYKFYLEKSGLLPSTVKEKILQILENKDE